MIRKFRKIFRAPATTTINKNDNIHKANNNNNNNIDSISSDSSLGKHGSSVSPSHRQTGRQKKHF